MTTPVHIDQTSSVPIYLQIVEGIERLVASGVLKPGDQLPTVRQLAVDLRLNPNTVARAYLELDRKGVISTQQGRGTFVAERPSHQALVQLREEKLRTMASRFVLEALSLGYTVTEIRRMIEQETRRWAESQRQRQ
jgi:GntR family transcriptional regulator